MSNLGMYQKIVEWSKRVGGPAPFLGLVAFGGYAVIRAGEECVRKACKGKHNNSFKKRNANNKRTRKVFRVRTTDDKENAAMLKQGDCFRVLAIDGDAALIVKLKDDNNPYIVFVDLLERISDFRRERY